MKTPLLLLFLYASLCSFSQKQNYNWVFGNYVGVSWNTGQPAAFTTSIMQSEGCASISDTAGNLLFYTDGMTIWNKLGGQMPHAMYHDLSGDYSSTQSALIVPDPGNNNRYYVFTASALEYSGYYGYNYGIVDMTLYNGLGDLTSSQSVQLYAPGSEKLCAVNNASNTGYWIGTHTYAGNQFYCFELTACGLSAPVISSAGRPYTKEQAAGYMKFANHGTMLAAAMLSDDSTGVNSVEVYNFDNSTGKVTYRLGIPYNLTGDVYGISFSPNDSKLYASNHDYGSVYQFDLSAGSASAVIATKARVSPQGNFDKAVQALQLGPDNRLYGVLYFNYKYLVAFTNPDLAGTACHYIDSAIYLGKNSGTWGLPNFISGSYVQVRAGGPHFTVTADKTALCGGDSAHICAPLGWQSYQWNVGDTTACMATGQAGNYFATAVTNTGCQLVSDTLIIITGKTPAPVAQSDKNTFCANDSAQICTTMPFTAYSWNVGGTASCIQAKQAGDYYVTVTDYNGCTAQSSHLSLNIYPASSVSIVQSGDTLSSYGEPGYQWYLNGNLINGATLPQYVAALAGSYTLQVTDTNGCTAQSEPVIINATGLQQLTENIIDVYPNPNISGSWQLSVGSEMIGSKLEVYDSEGRLVFHWEISNQKLAIDLPLSKGVYYLQISGNNTNVVKKLVRL